ncbi:hypothetical protein Desca_1438 [Desulfotomaculum nigrificans CO-1-SRB]|uniref:N-acetyltransferase domain-containing protein n=1 Tax=Desulfotomaculum nigrificans (strain DSM 14880 / VKM B-2319 / CO-1-SRB) TaxID=868595 RepID=F6B5X5_DESCC|nr:GNAT family N-acetyltransferase [Desulfotomaculum nigrificans]AEF94294.1 hypothetical protein Desca_1438 [Desulfotomaculum nigrificans CO-1-SRB]
MSMVLNTNSGDQENLALVKRVDNGVLKTSRGLVHLEGPCSSDYIGRLSMDEGLRNFRPPTRQKEALMLISNLPEGKVFIARFQDKIIGYVTFHYPDDYSRWSKNPYVLELGAVEISPEWRNDKIAHYLLLEAFAHSFVENYIVITIEFCWHWDLKNSGLTMLNYQKMLTKLFSTVGLQKRATDDPDITEHPANVLMVRFGKNVPKEAIQRFEELTFLNR